MKAYLTTIGEKTTDICKKQLERYGFDVVLLKKQKNWIDKYIDFITVATEDCLRIDADVIVNQNIKKVNTYANSGEVLLVGFTLYDLYQNGLFLGSPVFYSTKALEIMKNHLDKINIDRPEASMSRIPEINPYYIVDSAIVGIHGFFQDKETVLRAKENKIKRNQMYKYDFELVNTLMNL
jgi:hypothetical protein